MAYALACAFISFATAFFFVWRASEGVSWGHDCDLDGPQKFHDKPVPRLGGLGIFIAVALCGTAAAIFNNPASTEFVMLLGCSLPAAALGFAEDLTRRVSPRIRLIAAAISAVCGMLVLGALITRVDIPVLDYLLVWIAVSTPLTVIAVAGISNSVNIIDGFNGLASMVALMMFASIGYVAHTVGDSFILLVALSCIGAILGFFVWNYPLGLIFLGDGGAYFLGFTLAELAILLFQRHPQVSPWYAVLVFFYPTVETLFSAYRRRVIKGVPADQPDAFHLHSLIFRRLMRTATASHVHSKTHQNSMTSPYLWALCAVAVAPATIFWNNMAALVASCGAFLMLYMWLYRRIVRFRTPKWLPRRKTAPTRPRSIVSARRATEEAVVVE